MTLEGGPAAWRIDPWVTDAPEQQQRCCQLSEKLIEGLPPGNVEHRAEHTEGAGIERWTTDRLHQPVIHVGLVDVHLIEGATDRGWTSEIFKQQPLQHRAFQQRTADALPGDGTPSLGRLLFITEGTGCIQQHHTGTVLLECRTSR